MIDDARTLSQDFEEFKRNSKEIEEFLEGEVEELTERLLKKETQTKELKKEVQELKNRFLNQTTLVMKLHQDIENLTGRLEQESKTRKSLETENDSLINKTRNLEFRVSELEHEVYVLQEKQVLNQLDYEEEVKNKDKYSTSISVLPVVDTLIFKVCGIFNRRSLSGQHREFFVAGGNLSKYFHEFDEVIQSSFCDFFRSEIKKNQNFLHVFFGFRSIIRVLHRFFQSNENDWTAFQFSKSGPEYIWRNLTSNELSNLFNSGERNKKVHYLHLVRYKTSNLQIFDLCEHDSESSAIFQDLFQNAAQGSGFQEMVQCLNTRGKVFVNLNSADHEKLEKFIQNVNSIVHREKSTQTFGCCCKETTGNMVYLIAKYKKELEILRKRLKNSDIQLANAKEILKEKEKENKIELLRLNSSINHLQSILKERLDHDNSFKDVRRVFNRSNLNETRSRGKTRRVASNSMFDLENHNL